MALINNIETDLTTWKSTYNVVAGDDITAANVNKSPISNREDLLILNSVIGDVSTLIDVTSDTYDPYADNDLADPNTDIVSMISQLRIDIGNKNLLKTTDKRNIVNAINELNNNIYRPERSVELLALYDYNIHGNYIVDGGETSFKETIQESDLPSKRIFGAYPFYTNRRGVTTTNTEYNTFTINSGTFRVNGFEFRVDKPTDIYFQNSLNDTANNGLEKSISNLNITLMKEDTTYDYYQIQYGASVYGGISGLDSFMGLKSNVGSISFTIDSGNTTDSGDGTNITVIGTDLRDYIESSGTEGNIDFDTVKLELIDQSIVIDSTTYPFELTSNGDGIHWTSGNPALNSSFTIDAGNLYYYGIKTRTNIDQPSYGTDHAITIEDDKQTIKVPKLLGYYTGVGSFGSVVSPSSPETDFRIVLPRTDSIFVRIIKNDYEEQLWDSGTDYMTKDIVVYNGNVYRSLIDYNSNNQPDLSIGVDWEHLGVSYNGLTLQPEFLLVEGSIDSEDNPTIPEASGEYMRLCYIFNFYGQDPVVSNIENRSYSMTELNKLAKGVEDLEYNLQRLALSVDSNISDSTFTRDFFVESFETDEFRDEELELSHIDSDAKTPYSGDIIDGSLSQAVNWNSSTLQAHDGADYIKQTITLDPIESTTIVEQPYSTNSTLINEFQLSAPPIVKLSVSPRVYRYISREVNININRTIRKENVNVTRKTEYKYSAWWWNPNKVTETKTSTTTVSVKNYSNSYYIRTSTPQVIPDFNVHLYAPSGSFNGDETVQVTVDKKLQPSVSANSDGSLSATVTLNGVKTGKNDIEVLGVGNSGGYISGARGNNRITTESWIKTNIKIKVTTITKNINKVITTTRYIANYDPVAETFLVKNDTYIHSLYIKLDAEDINGNSYEFPDGKLPENVLVSLFGTTAGLPDWEQNMASGMIPKGTNVVIANEDWIQVEFEQKVKLYENKVYAVVIGTGYETYKRVDTGGGVLDVQSSSGTRLKVKVAKVGETAKDSNGIPFTVTSQPYIDGVLLKSSNIVTWSPYQLEDLTFKITSSTFNPSKVQNYKVLNGVSSLSQITDIKMQNDTHLEANTSVSYRVNHDSGNFNVLPDLSVIRSELTDFNNIDMDVTLSSYSSSLSDIVDTPIVSENIELYYGTVAEKCVYVTKNIDLSNGLGVRSKFVKLYIDSNEYFSDSKVKIYYTTDFVINNDHTDPGCSWIELTRDTGYVGVENEYFYSSGALVSVGNSLRIKVVTNIDLSTESAFARPEVKNMRLFLADS